MPFRKLVFQGYRTSRGLDEIIGPAGQILLDTITGELRFYDGETTGGSRLVAISTESVTALPSGGAASRPVSPILGQVYFDTDLGTPIFWYNDGWVNAFGAPV